jgi:hypothetical protein
MTCRKRISCHVLLYTRMDETAPIDSAALFGSSFWVDDVRTGGLKQCGDLRGIERHGAHAALRTRRRNTPKSFSSLYGVRSRLGGTRTSFSSSIVFSYFFMKR